MQIQNAFSSLSNRSDSTTSSFDRQLNATRAAAKSDGANAQSSASSSPSGEARADARTERRAARAEAREARTEARAENRAERDSAREAARETAREARAESRAARDTARAEARDARQGVTAPGGNGGVSSGDQSSGAPTTDGQILGGVTEPGAVIDPVTGDFTRDGGSAPIADVSVEDLGANADGTRNIRVNFTNSAPEGGTFLTPPWVAIQDGSFDIYDEGASAAEFLERIAEDGSVEPIGAAFEESGAQGAAGVITGPDGIAAGPLDTGETGSIVLTVDPENAQFLSFASMVIPSNDAFISSPDDPRGIRIFDENGNFVAEDVTITGADVLDAGTEVNTEQDAAFLNQTAPDTGVDENGVVGAHPGFIGSEGLPATDGPTVADMLRRY